MKTSVSLEYRLTHGYVAGWAPLDAHIWVCAAKRTQPKRVSGDKDGDSETMQAVVTISPVDMAVAHYHYQKVLRDTRQQRGALTFSRFLRYAIGDYFTSGCQCEFDCCGHWQTNGSAVQTKRREFAVTINCYRNV